jgi:molybdopterin molybdotransferase
MLSALAVRDGGVLETPLPIEPVSDDRKTISSLLSRPGADVVLVSGGTSVGTEDHAPTLVTELGELVFHGVAMRPSSPTGIGRVGDALVFLLPGNPVSCLAAYDVFAGETVRRMGGKVPDWPYTRITAILDDKIASDIGRLDYCRVSISDDDTSISPLSISGASILSSTTRADGFVMVPPELEGYAAGQSIQAWRYDRQPFDRGGLQ